MRTVFATAITLAVAVLTMLLALQRQLIFPRQLIEAPTRPVRLPEGAEQIWIETPEGEVEGWYLRGSGRTAEEPGPAVIFAHGNGEIIDNWPQLLEWYAARGVSALLAEYRGYGRSAGDPSSAKITEDMVRFRSWLTDRPEVDPSRLVYHGRSLGGGAVCALATRQAPALLVLQSTFTSLSALAWHHYYLPSGLLRDEFDNLSFLERSDIPVLITHGVEDEIIPVEQARRLDRAASNSKLVEIPGRGHNDTPMQWEAIESFLHSHALLDSGGGDR